jgi:hypothetical protein
LAAAGGHRHPGLDQVPAAPAMTEPAPASAITMPTALPSQASANCSMPGKPASAHARQTCPCPRHQWRPAGRLPRRLSRAAAEVAQLRSALMERWLRSIGPRSGHAAMASWLSCSHPQPDHGRAAHHVPWAVVEAAGCPCWAGEGPASSRGPACTLVHAGPSAAKAEGTRPAGKSPACGYAPQSRSSARANETEK